MKVLCRTTVFLAALAGSVFGAEPAVTLRVKVDQPGASINKAMWGIFYEDINFAADGGLYAELVKNGSFEFPNALMGWTVTPEGAAVTVRDTEPFSAVQPHFVRVETSGEGGAVTLANEGFRGIGVREGAGYDFFVTARQIAGENRVRVELANGDGRVLASSDLGRFTSAWQSHKARLTAAALEPKADLRIVVEGTGTLELDLCSLFPADAWRGRLRPDLVQVLAELSPGFMRFPGGCIVEGRTLANRYQWKDTIGDMSQRKLNLNRWNVERPRGTPAAPDYYQSYGLGYYEYFLLCEGIGAAPLPILNCGMACQFNSGELAPLDALDPYIQDALDLIEFANGPATSTWGAKRAAMGHPQPFGMTLLGVGNEQWGPQYIERYARFHEVVKAKHPEIQLVAGVGPDAGGERFDFLWNRLRTIGADLIDEHYYRPPEFFFTNTRRYDRYDRTGPKVFAGEYAAHLRNRENNLEAALAEAAMMTGFERNADVVRMASYAPLFGHIDAWQWRPNLIWFDNLRVVRTPNYYVQQMFATNRGDRVLPIAIETNAAEPPARLYASAVLEDATGEAVLKVVNASPQSIEASLQWVGAKASPRTAKRTVLTAPTSAGQNSLDQPGVVGPVDDLSPIAAPPVFAPFSLTVLRARTE